MTITGLILLILIVALFWATLKWGTGEHFAEPRNPFSLPQNIPAFRKEGPPRRTERVLLSLPVLVTGQDVSGNSFSEETRTTTISGYGAGVVSNRRLKPGQEIVISRPAESRHANCHVVWEGKGEKGSYVYGVAFTEPTADLWGVCKLLAEATAPPPQEAPRAPAKRLDAT